MKTNDLVDYVAYAVKEGKSFRMITFELVNAGWDPLDIQQSIEYIQQSRFLSSDKQAVKDATKPLSPALTPSSNPLPVLVKEERPLSLQKKRTLHGPIPASRVFTSYLQKQLRGEYIPVEKTPVLADTPVVEITQPIVIQEKEKKEEETVSLKEKPLVPPVPPKGGYENTVIRPEGYFIPTVPYLADEAILEKQDIQTLAGKIGKPSFISPKNVVISMWKREQDF